MWTKRQLIESAYEEIGLASYEFDLSPEEWQSALRKMDTMIATWQGKGINTGYAIPGNPDDSDLDNESGLQDLAVEAVYLNLAIRLAPSFGKQITQTTQASAKDAYNTLLNQAAFPPQQQFPNTLPVGAGSKYWRNTQNPFIRGPNESTIRENVNGNLDFLES